ncbi:hypothetical protein RB195_015759 [Necator americanus]|uniref:RNA-directed DNA polymerase n=1 Tax=Necator americanus TaxID=51031 RepID=A0ABR1E616_NECAM
MTRMTMLARGYVYWTNIHRDIEETVRHCRNCQEAAKMPKKTVLISWTSEKKPLDRIHIDYAGPLNECGENWDNGVADDADHSCMRPGEYKRLLATGWGKSGENYAKPATKMIELQYDKALEDKTVTKIKNCASSSSSAIGENFWSKEVTATNNIGEDGIEKIAYDGATKVGCAIDFGAACPKLGKLYIMSPAIDDVIYEAGNEACAKCASTGTTPVCSPIGGLCVAAS